MNSLQTAINEFKQAFSKALSSAQDATSLESVRVDFLGRKGRITDLMESLKILPIEEKRNFGPLLNELKQWAEQSYFDKRNQFELQAQTAELEKQKNFDVTATVSRPLRGSLHPMTHIKQRVENIFISMGYQVIDGPEIDNDYFNFEALNIPENHPARDMWDTFWLDVPNLLLRTHTSSVQARALATHKPPFAAIVPGRTFRHEATDATHDFQFMQIEGVVVDKNISMSHLIATCKAFLQEMFGSQELSLRIRPSYFPFTEPSIEIDISCPFCTSGCSVCKYSRWIESGGAGLVHPHVLKNAGINAEEYSGFAFGFGLTRLAMLMYGINDIRLLHSGKIEFLEQFS